MEPTSGAHGGEKGIRAVERLMSGSHLDDKIKHSHQQEISVTFWDKNAKRYEEIASDSSLLAAFDMYREVGRLPLIVLVSDDPRNRTEANVEQDNIEEPDSNEGEGQEIAFTNI
ncbi:hypothetical protein E2562_016126, partial [Oryza meyeriana var. granulata]